MALKATSKRRPLRLVRVRRLSAGAQLGLMLLLAVALTLLLNLLATHLDYVWQTPRSPVQISPRTRTMMAATRGRLEAVVLIPRTHPAFDRTRRLLLDLQSAAAGAGAATVVPSFVDPYRDLAEATQLARRHGVSGWGIIFISGERSEVVPADELLEAAPPGDGLPGIPAPPPRFLGEVACVTAIARLARPTAPVVYALQGHGERDLHDYDPMNGYTDLAREMRREGYELRPLTLGTARDVPGDCDVLLVAGPRQAPLAEERTRLLAFLASGGRLLLLLDRAESLPHGWEEVLAALGVQCAQLTAVGPQTLQGQTLVVDRFESHPITRDLANTVVYFVSPQVFDISEAHGDAVDRPRVSSVVVAPPDAWGETNPTEVPRHYDPAIDRVGALPLVVAIERGAGSGNDVGLRPLRAVVCGDSHFAVNALLAGGRSGNRDLLLNALNWLVEGGLPTAPSAPDESRLWQLGLSRRKQLRLIFRSVVIWPLAVLLGGAACVALRRR